MKTAAPPHVNCNYVVTLPIACVKIGQRTDKPGIELPQNFAEVSGQETRQIAAKAAGFVNAATYRRDKCFWGRRP